MNDFEAIAIGASAGGIRCLRMILAELPHPFPLPLLVVQHIHHAARIDFARVFRIHPALLAKEAEDKESICPQTLYLAPPGYHLLVEKNRSLSLSVDPPVCYARPSIDVLFETAADAFRERLIGVVLTGANSDGARGLLSIKQQGGFTIVQDPNEAEVPTMPKAAIELAEPHRILTAEGIGHFLTQLIQ